MHLRKTEAWLNIQHHMLRIWQNVGQSYQQWLIQNSEPGIIIISVVTNYLVKEAKHLERKTQKAQDRRLINKC